MDAEVEEDRMRMGSRAWRTVVGSAVVSAVLGTAACSSGDAPDAATGAPGSSAAAAPSAGTAGSTYLALGDSIAFGYQSGLKAARYADTDSFTGYPELLADSKQLEVVNAACPGETSGSFLDTTAASNGCENVNGSGEGFRDAYALHTDYTSADQSQLAFAVDTLKSTQGVSLVTLQVGANDLFLCQKTTSDGCVSEAGTTVQDIAANVRTILDGLRDQAGYTGEIVLVNYYSLDYTDALTTAVIKSLDDAVAADAAAADAVVADAYTAFSDASKDDGGDLEKAGLLFEGDVHPTARGQQLLADTVTAALGS